MRAGFKDRLPQNRVGKGKNSNLTEERGKPYSNQASGVHISREKSRGDHAPLTGVTRRALRLCEILPETHNPRLTVKKKFRQTQILYSTKYLTRALQNCQGHGKKGEAKKMAEKRGDYGDLMTKCHMRSILYESIKKDTQHNKNWTNYMNRQFTEEKYKCQ